MTTTARSIASATRASEDGLQTCRLSQPEAPSFWRRRSSSPCPPRCGPIEEARACQSARCCCAAASALAATDANSANERFAACLACHGEGGRSVTPLTPSLAGQHSFYAITQLFLFREGRRSNPPMTAVAKGMTDADMRAFADLIARLPGPPPASMEGLDAKRMANGATLASQHLPPRRRLQRRQLVGPPRDTTAEDSCRCASIRRVRRLVTHRDERDPDRPHARGGHRLFPGQRAER